MTFEEIRSEPLEYEFKLPQIPAQIIQTTQDLAEKPRLIMKRMVLENFKSYANRIEVGPFHKASFSCQFLI